MSRRWVMLSCALITSALGAHWVALAAGPAKEAAGQNSAKADAASDKPSVVALGEPTELDRALEKPVTLKFADVPLKDVASLIAKQTGINVVLDHRALADAGVSEDTRLTIDLPELPLNRALRSFLFSHDLNYTTADNVLTITYADISRARIVTRLYNVRELANALRDFDGPSDAWREVIDVVQSTVAPQSWDCNGGAGSVRCQEGILIVSQNEELQQQIAELLTGLVRLRRAPRGTEVDRLGDSFTSPLWRKLDEVQDVHFAGGKLPDLVVWLQARGIPAVLDKKALAEASATDVSLRPLDAHKVTMRWILKRLLGEVDLTFVIDHDALLLTADDKAKATVVTFLYPVGDLIDAAADSSGTDPETAFNELMETIRTAVAPSSWDDAGGAGGLMPFTPARVLVCDQTFAIQPTIETLLADLRAAYKTARAASPEKGPAKPVAILKSYQLIAPARKSRTTSGPEPAEQYAALVRTTIEPKIWTDGSASISVIPAGLVVRATPAVQARVGRLLEHVGAWIRPVQKSAAGNQAGAAFEFGPPMIFSPSSAGSTTPARPPNAASGQPKGN